eukprot:COSAG05_NODE_2498_length_2979_cov_29.040286_5_plen_93_part_00
MTLGVYLVSQRAYHPSRTRPTTVATSSRAVHVPIDMTVNLKTHCTTHPAIWPPIPEELPSGGHLPSGGLGLGIPTATIYGPCPFLGISWVYV